MNLFREIFTKLKRIFLICIFKIRVTHFKIKILKKLHSNTTIYKLDSKFITI